jgi:hypothetical protein
MKRFFIVFLAVSMIIFPAAFVPVAAGPDGESYGDVKKVNDGDIKIDAVKDETVWVNALALPVNRISPTSPNQERDLITGMVYILWSDKGVYVFGEINDTTPTHTPHEDKTNKDLPNWNVDSLEIFVDIGNIGDSSNVQHNKVDIDGLGYIYLAGEGGASYIDKDETAPYMEYAGKLDGNTYYLETLIHVPGASYKVGDQIGIQFQINDMTDPDLNQADNRVVILSPNANDADSWEIAGHNYIVLSAESAMPIAPEPEPESTGGNDSPEPAAAVVQTSVINAPQTGDIDVGVFFLIISSLGLAFILRKKITAK